MKKNPNISVISKTIYLSDQSSLENQRFLWTYEITIENNGAEIIQLLNRYWRITDLTSHVEEVRGPGVLGLQPIIKPQKSFVYSSYCQLTVPQGTMEGYYEIQNLDEARSIVEIPKFILSTPSDISALYRSKLH
jgi:ApaG protein